MLFIALAHYVMLIDLIQDAMVLYEAAMQKYLQLTGLGATCSWCMFVSVCCLITHETCTHKAPKTWYLYLLVHNWTKPLISAQLNKILYMYRVLHESEPSMAVLGFYSMTFLNKITNHRYVEPCTWCCTCVRPYISHTAPERDAYVLPNAIYSVQQILRDILMRTLDYKVHIGVH